MASSSVHIDEEAGGGAALPHPPHSPIRTTTTTTTTTTSTTTTATPSPSKGPASHLQALQHSDSLTDLLQSAASPSGSSSSPGGHGRARHASPQLSSRTRGRKSIQWRSMVAVYRSRDGKRQERKKPAYGSFYKSTESPGPGAYESSPTKRARGPTFSMGRRYKNQSFLDHAMRQGKDSPGPGTYTVRRTRLQESSRVSPTGGGSPGGGVTPRNPMASSRRNLGTTTGYSFGTSMKLTTKDVAQPERRNVQPFLGKQFEHESLLTHSQGPGRYNTKSMFDKNARSGVGVHSKPSMRTPSFGFGSSARF